MERKWNQFVTPLPTICIIPSGQRVNNRTWAISENMKTTEKPGLRLKTEVLMLNLYLTRTQSVLDPYQSVPTLGFVRQRVFFTQDFCGFWFSRQELGSLGRHNRWIGRPHFGPWGPNMVLSTLKRILRYSRIRMHPVSSSSRIGQFDQFTIVAPSCFHRPKWHLHQFMVNWCIQLGCVQSRQCESLLAFAMWSPQDFART